MKVRAIYGGSAPRPTSQEVVIFRQADELGPLKQSGQPPCYIREARIFKRLGMRSAILLKDLLPGTGSAEESPRPQSPANVPELFSLDRRL